MLITCPECGKTVSDKAETCVHCGAPIQKTATTVSQEPVSTETLSTPDVVEEVATQSVVETVSIDDLSDDDFLMNDIVTEDVQPKKTETVNISPKIDYMSLSDYEKKQLLKRFKKEVPEHSKALKAQAVFGIFNSIYMIAMLITTVVLIVFLLALGPKVDITIPASLYLTIAIIMGSFFVHFAFMSVVMSTIIRLLNKATLKNWKYMEIWTKKQNIENFRVIFINPKFEKIYQELEIDEE